MRWYRVYAEDREFTLSHGRAIVWDPKHCEPFYISDYNYCPLFEKADDDIVTLEWDIALSKEDRERFTAHIESAPGLVHVAPYRHYQYKEIEADFGWVVRGDGVSAEEGTPLVPLFGLGCTYVPLWLIRAFLRDMDLSKDDLHRQRGLIIGDYMHNRFASDVVFSSWHYIATGHHVPVHWDVRPVHLNYEV